MQYKLPLFMLPTFFPARAELIFPYVLHTGMSQSKQGYFNRAIVGGAILMQL